MMKLEKVSPDKAHLNKGPSTYSQVPCLTSTASSLQKQKQNRTNKQTNKQTQNEKINIDPYGPTPAKTGRE